jgi:hypothetical protein
VQGRCRLLRRNTHIHKEGIKVMNKQSSGSSQKRSNESSAVSFKFEQVGLWKRTRLYSNSASTIDGSWRWRPPAGARVMQLVFALSLTVALTIVLGGLLTSKADDHNPNLLANGYFADGADGWTSLSDASITIRGDLGDAASGTQYVHLEHVVGLAGISQTFETISGTVYNFDYAFTLMPGPEGQQSSISVDWIPVVGSTHASVTPTDVPATDWSQAGMAVTAPADESTIEFTFNGAAASHGALIDDVRVTAATCESTANGAWESSNTWDCGGVPGAGNDVVINAGHTVSLAGDFDGGYEVNNLAIDGTLESNGASLTIYGDLTQNGEYQAAGNNDVVTFAGIEKQNIQGSADETRFHKLEVDGAGIEATKKIAVNDMFEAKSGKTDIRDAEFNRVKINAAAEMEGNGGERTYTGDKQIEGKYTATAGRDRFIGDENQDITGASKADYREMEIDKTDSDREVKVAAKLEVHETLRVQRGKLISNSIYNNVEIEENGTLEAGDADESRIEVRGNWKNDGMFNAKLSTVAFTRAGTEKQKIEGLSGETRFHKLEVDGAGIEATKKIAVNDMFEAKSGKSDIRDAEFNRVKINDAAEMEGNGGERTYTGDKQIEGKYTATAGRDRFIGDADQDITGTSKADYREMEIDKAEIAREVRVATQLEVHEALLVTRGKLKTNTIFGDVVIGPEGVLESEDDEPTFVRGNWINDGEYIPGNGPFILDGVAPQSIGGQSETNFNNLDVRNETQVNSSIKVNNKLSLSSEISYGETGSLVQGENFEIEVLSGANLGVGCDPGDVKLTGGGWFDSPAGAYLADESLGGKAHFNFPVHCGEEGEEPVGDLSLELPSAGFEFESAEIDSMIVLGNEATLTGYGTVNGAGDYGFAAVAVEGAPGNSGDPNQLSMVIWDRDSDSTVYDSDGPIDTGGGNIKIHTGSGGGPGSGDSQGDGSSDNGNPGRGPNGNGPPGRR